MSCMDTNVGHFPSFDFFVVFAIRALKPHTIVA